MAIKRRCICCSASCSERRSQKGPRKARKTRKKMKKTESETVETGLHRFLFYPYFVFDFLPCFPCLPWTESVSFLSLFFFCVFRVFRAFRGQNSLAGVTADAAREKGQPVIITEAVDLRRSTRTITHFSGNFLQHVGLTDPAAEGTLV